MRFSIIKHCASISFFQLEGTYSHWCIAAYNALIKHLVVLRWWSLLLYFRVRRRGGGVMHWVVQSRPIKKSTHWSISLVLDTYYRTLWRKCMILCTCNIIKFLVMLFQDTVVWYKGQQFVQHTCVLPQTLIRMYMYCIY